MVFVFKAGTKKCLDCTKKFGKVKKKTPTMESLSPLLNKSEPFTVVFL